EVVAPEEIMAAWSTEKGKMQFIESLNDKKIFNEMVLAADSIVNSFETGDLSEFYQKAHDAIRATGSKQIIFLEHSYFCNIGVASRFKMPLNSDGKPDKLCCYAPHGYDFVTDTKNNTMQGRERVEFIFEQVAKNSVSKASPLIVGEWGAYYNGDKAFTAASEHSIGIFESKKFSQSYWSYWDAIEKHEYFAKTIVRNYPMATSGELIMYKNDFENNLYTQKWREQSSDKAVTRVFVKNIDQCNISLQPESSFEKIKIEGSNNGYLEIKPLGCDRELTIESCS
ncbi:MAG: cellulase family glycosylhydrolase, partial [Rikenellaceae bacterium]